MITKGEVVADQPEIVFPCEYPIKVIGIAGKNFQESVADIVLRHCPEFDARLIKVVDSRNGNYVSLRFSIVAKGKAQIQQLFLDLKTNKNVQMVL